MSNQKLRPLPSFARGLAETRALRKETGKANAKAMHVTPQGFNLGAWQCKFKRYFHRGRLNRSQIEQLKDLGFNFSIQSSSRDIFARGLKEFLAYKREHKTNLIPGRYISPSGFRLGLWQHRIRYRYKLGRLSRESLRLLNSAGFRWRGDRSQYCFTRSLEATIRYKETFGKANAPSSYITLEGFRLGEWQSKMRKFRSRHRLSRQRIKDLSRLGFVWKNPSLREKFERGILATTRFKKTFGQANALSSYRTPEGFRLGEWQWRQRIKHLKRKLREEEIKKLKAVGYDFALSPPDHFKRGFTETLKIKEKTGNANVIRSFVTRDGYKLGRWQSYMRCNYQAGRLAKDKIRRLERTGFIWNLLEHSFERGFQETIRYRKLHGTPNCPALYTTPDGYRLGQWQTRIKTNRKKQILTSAQVRRLEAIGFRWQLRTSRVH
jgi:Helicase associated domain